MQPDRKINLNAFGIWFWLAIAIGLALRIYLAVFTDGTLDVAIWERHARDVQSLGITGYYRADDSANHPPFISEVESVLVHCADATGIRFRVLLRAPFILFDAGNALLLLLLLPPNRWRFPLVAVYWLSPLSLIFSAYHGNTDCAIAFFLLLCVWFLTRERILAAAVVLGISFWIKLPGIIALPAMVFFIKGWRSRLLFLIVAGIAAISTYVPALIMDAPVVWKNVFAYHGLRLGNAANQPLWGLRVLLFDCMARPQNWPEITHAPILFLFKYGSWIGLALLTTLSWLRRNQRSTSELCVTIAGSYLLLYSFTDEWTFQYFAWSAPFWFFLRPWLFVPVVATASGYIYSLYWFLCGNPLLLGKWDFFGRADWPPIVIWFRNGATLVFFAASCVLLAQALWPIRTGTNSMHGSASRRSNGGPRGSLR